MSAERPNTGHMQSLIQNIMRKFETRAPVTNTSPSPATSAPSAPEPQQPLQPRPVPPRQVLPTPSNYSQASNSVQQVDKPKVAATFLHFYAGSNNKSTSSPTTTSPSDQHRQYNERSYSSEMRHPNDFQYQPPSNFYSAPPRSVEESPSTLDQVLVRPANESRPRYQERVDPPPLDATTRSLLLQFQARPASFKIDSNLFKRPTVQAKPSVPVTDHPSPENTPLVDNEARFPDVRPDAIEQPTTYSNLETNRTTHPNEPLASVPISAVEVQHPTSELLASGPVVPVHLSELVGSCVPSPPTEYDSCVPSLPIEQEALMPVMPTVASTPSTDESAFIIESVPVAAVVTATEANGESQRVLEASESVPAMNPIIHVPTLHPPAVHAQPPPHLLHAPHAMDNLSASSSGASEVTLEQQLEPAPMPVSMEMDRSIAEAEQARLIGPHSVESVEANVNQLAEREPQLLVLAPVTFPSTTEIVVATFEPPSNAVVMPTLTETDVQKLIVENERMLYNAINDRAYDDVSSLPTSGPCLNSPSADEVMHYDGPSVACPTNLTEKGQRTDAAENDLRRSAVVNVPANEQSLESFGPCQPTSEALNEALAGVDNIVNEPMVIEVSEAAHPAESMKDLQADSNLATHANTEAMWNATITQPVVTETSLITAPSVPADEISSVPLIVDDLPPIVDSLPNNAPIALYVNIASDINSLPTSDASTEELHGAAPVLAALPEQAISPGDQRENVAHQSTHSVVEVLPSQTTDSMVHERVIETKTTNVETSLLTEEAVLMPAIEAESTQGTESLHTAASDRPEETAVNCKKDTEHVAAIQQPFERSDAVEDDRTCVESIEMHKKLPAQLSEITDTEAVPMEQTPVSSDLPQGMMENQEEAPLALPVNLDFRLERALPTTEQDSQMSLNETAEREGQLRPIEVSTLPSEEPSHSLSLKTLRAPEQTVVESASTEQQRIHQSPEEQYFAIPAAESAQQYDATEEVKPQSLVVHSESGGDVEPPSDQYVENAANDSRVHQNIAVEDAMMADTPCELTTQLALPALPDIEPVNDFVAAKSAQVTRDEAVNYSAEINTCSNLNFSIDGERFQREQVKTLLDDEDHVLPSMKFHSEAASEPQEPVVETRTDFSPVFDTDYSAAVEHLLNPDAYEEFEPVDIFNPDNLTPLEVFIFTLEGVPLRFNKQSTSVSTSTAINTVKSKKRKRTQTLHPNFLKHVV